MLAFFFLEVNLNLLTVSGKKFMNLVGVFVVTILLQACTSGYSGSSQAQLTDSNYDPDRIRCKTQAKTGTRLGSRVCKTNSDWNQAQTDAQEAVDHIQRRGAITSNPSGG
jgi:hypothetical protein